MKQFFTVYLALLEFRVQFQEYVYVRKSYKSASGKTRQIAFWYNNLLQILFLLLHNCIRVFFLKSICYRFCSFGCLETAMKSYHQIESKIDINQLFYSNDIETGQMSGCISLAYRAITQKNLQFFLQNKDKLFGHYDTKFGIDMPQKFSYTGDEHYRWVQNLPNH